jgi:hypothetical protein
VKKQLQGKLCFRNSECAIFIHNPEIISPKDKIELGWPYTLFEDKVNKDNLTICKVVSEL